MPPLVDSRRDCQSSGADRRHARWQLLPDELWAHIATFMGTYDKMNLEQTCIQFRDMFANPANQDTWGKLELAALRVVTDNRLWWLCEWLQRRLAGISAIGLNYGTDVEPEATSKLWHALVASTSGTNIRLRVCTGLAAAASVLTPPLKAELQQRLTALDIGVAHAHEIAVVHSLTALRHLWLCDHPESGARLSEAGVGSSMRPCQMSSLRTLQLHSIAPGAFFIPGSAASLQHLHKLRLIRCPFPDRCLPSELLRLPALRHFEIFNVTGRLLSMPDLRGLSALRSLVVYKGPRLRSLCGTSSAELEASLTGRPLCGATGLTRLCLSSTLIDASRYADAIERLPQLKVLHVDYSTCNVAAFYAAKLQRQLRGRCSVRPATKCRALDWLGDDW